MPAEEEPLYSRTIMTVRSLSLARVPSGAQWLLLVLSSAFLSVLFELARLPAALLLGPMVGGILLSVAGGSLRVPRIFHSAAQAVIGCMIARNITPEILVTFRRDWPLFIGIVIFTIVSSSLLGWLLGRLRILPGTTAVWGLSPGAASVMMMMAESYGADARLVAFMQYLRVVMVAAAASLIVRFWMNVHTLASRQFLLYSPVHWHAFLETLLILVIGGALGRLSRVPAGALLLPMFLGATLHGTHIISIELPPWLLAASYSFLGWTIGLGFTWPIIVHALRTLPQTILAILTLIVVCGGLAFWLVHTLGISPLTAYLATSPGGMDSVAIIAAATHNVDVPFVMALQTSRFMTVLLIGPAISRWVANRMEKPETPGSKGWTPDYRPIEPKEEKILEQVREDEDELD